MHIEYDIPQSVIDITGIPKYIIKMSLERHFLRTGEAPNFKVSKRGGICTFTPF